MKLTPMREFKRNVGVAASSEHPGDLPILLIAELLLTSGCMLHPSPGPYQSVRIHSHII